MVSLAVSLTTTPMMCARLLKPESRVGHGRWYAASERVFDWARHGYEKSLGWALRHPRFIVSILAATVCLNVYLYIIVPKGFFPQQDIGRLTGSIQADQSSSFQAMQQKLADFVKIIQSDPAVESVTGFTGGGRRNGGFMFISLKPKSERKLSADQVIARLRGKLNSIAGATLFLQPVQDIRVGGRQSDAQYQFTLQGDNLEQLRTWTPRLQRALAEMPELVDVTSDQQEKGLQTTLVIDRATAGRMGVTTRQIDATLNDAFGQAIVSTIYSALNQYRVVMEVAPKYWQSPETLKDIYVRAVPIRNSTATGGGFTTVAKGSSATVTTTGNTTGTTSGCVTVTVNGCATATTSTGGNTGNVATTTLANAISTSAETLVPLSAFSSYEPTTTPLAVNHQGQFVASTISFSLPVGKSLSDAVAAVNDTMARIGVPATIYGTFQGTARAFQASTANQLWLILAALITVYIVLGMLYESYVHPLTILSTLPSAGVGALLALLLFRTEFSIIALIGVILLIGIVKKNAIMMIDFALATERGHGKSPEEAIFEACLLRFRPIMMTTMAALLGAVPLAIGFSDGSEFRRPLGISIVGGLILSQLLTLYTTPVVYLYLDRFRLWCQRVWGRKTGRVALEAR
jgi:multidrug efflux pump